MEPTEKIQTSPENSSVVRASPRDSGADLETEILPENVNSFPDRSKKADAKQNNIDHCDANKKKENMYSKFGLMVLKRVSRFDCE